MGKRDIESIGEEEDGEKWGKGRGREMGKREIEMGKREREERRGRKVR